MGWDGRDFKNNLKVNFYLNQEGVQNKSEKDISIFWGQMYQDKLGRFKKIFN